MDGLLCDEVWLSTSPATPDYSDEPQLHNVESSIDGSFYTKNNEDCKQAFSLCLEKELSYIPEPGYVEHLRCKNLFFARFRAIQWLIKSRIRLNLSFATVFNAANYLDRFLSMNQCSGWKHWMIELLSVACLSVASKFSETSAPTLPEIQMEDLDHSFQSITIQRMELMLLQALGWRLRCITSYSYAELLIMNINDSLNSNLQKDLVARVTELLLGAMLDCKVVEYRASIVALSALWCCVEELVPSKSDTHLAYVKGLFHQDQKDDLVKCYNIMEERLVNPLYNLLARGNPYYYPSSPVTVLLTERIDIEDRHVDLSLFKVPGSNAIDLDQSSKKRKRVGK